MGGYVPASSFSKKGFAKNRKEVAGPSRQAFSRFGVMWMAATCFPRTGVITNLENGGSN